MSSSSSAIATEDYVPDPARWRILIVVLTVIFMSLVSVSIINVALASIQEALDASQSDIQWILAGYTLTFGMVLVSAGRAGDLMGRGGFFILGVLIFTLGSIGAGLAMDATSLNIARLVQGLGSGCINPQGIGMIQQYFRGAERGRAFGMFGTTVGISVAIGPVLGGFLIELGGSIGWRLTFLINLPAGVLALVLAYLWFPRPLFNRLGKNTSNATKQGLSSLDPIGALLLGLAVLTVLLPFVEAPDKHLIWLLLPLGLILFYIWVKWESFYSRKGFSPMVELKIFSTASFRNGALIMMLYFFCLTSIWVLIPLFIQQGLGHSALDASLIGIPSALLSAWSSNWSGKRVSLLGRKLVLGGLVLSLLGLAASVVLVFMHQQSEVSFWWLAVSLGIFGIGQGAVISPNQTLTLAEVPLAYAGSSGAIIQTGQRVGSSVGIAAITALVFALLPGQGWHLAFAVGLLSIMAILLLVLAISALDWRAKQATS